MTVLVTDPLISGYLDEPDWEVLVRRPDDEVIDRPAADDHLDVLVAARVTTLAGRTVGVVGLGEIGCEVVRGLTTLGMRADMSGPDELPSTSDIVVLAVPLTDETRA